MGKTLPAAGYVSDAARTTGESKNEREDRIEILKRLIGIGEPKEAVQISAGQVTPASGGWLELRNEGDTSNDLLDFIDVSHYADGSIIALQARATQSHTIRDASASGGGQDSILFPSNFPTGLDPARPTEKTFLLQDDRLLFLRRLEGGIVWTVYAWSWGGDTADERAFLGLGTAAVLDDGAVDAATLQGSPASAFLGATAKAADAELLDGIDSGSFVRNDLGAEQQIAHNVKVGQGRLAANNASGLASSLDLEINDVLRFRVAIDDGPTNQMLLQYFDAAGLLNGGIRFDEDGYLRFYNQATGAWQPLNQHLLEGHQPGEAIWGTGGVKQAEFVDVSVPANSTSGLLQVNSVMCWEPIWWQSVATGVADGEITLERITASSAFQDTTSWFLRNGNLSFTAIVTVKVRYIPGVPNLNP